MSRRHEALGDSTGHSGDINKKYTEYISILNLMENANYAHSCRIHNTGKIPAISDFYRKRILKASEA